MVSIDSFNSNKAYAIDRFKTFLSCEHQSKTRQTERSRLESGGADGSINDDDGMSHYFSELPEHKMLVEAQHNGIDCGLYVLKRIEKIAEHQPNLTGKMIGKKRDRCSFDSSNHPEICFTSSDIDQFRKKMRTDIEELARRQNQERRDEEAHKQTVNKKMRDRDLWSRIPVAEQDEHGREVIERILFQGEPWLSVRRSNIAGFGLFTDVR